MHNDFVPSAPDLRHAIRVRLVYILEAERLDLLDRPLQGVPGGRERLASVEELADPFGRLADAVRRRPGRDGLHLIQKRLARRLDETLAIGEPGEPIDGDERLVPLRGRPEK